MTTLLLFLHLIFATIWVGGHIILCIGFLPRALYQKNRDIITEFESVYEKIGIPSLIGQVITGILLSIYKVSNWQELFLWNSFYGRHFILKIFLLVLTIILAIHARLKIIPDLKESNLKILGIHIILVTIISIFFVLVGLSFRINIFYF